jgi:D-methionine transport system substrate-binding protein
MRRFFISTLLLLASLLLLSTSCEKSSKPTLKVAATSIPHAEILELIQPHLQAQNIEFEIVIIDDFNMPNRALADREVDANFFQHLPFLEAQQIDFGYALESLVAVHLEPMALYSKKHLALEEIKEGALIALPSDASNQARALTLCEEIGWVTLKTQGTKTSVLDIASNPRHLHFIEMDSPLLSRALDDVDAAFITINFALLAGLSPQRDALAIEKGQSRFANIVAIRKGEQARADLHALKMALITEQIRQFIEERYQGAIIPAF